MMGKYVFSFDSKPNLGKALLGGKGSALNEMTNLGLNVPQGFTITTETCNLFYQKSEVLWDDLKIEITTALKKLENDTGKVFGGVNNPLLVSVRSGAAISMPGMMDTILNLGLNDTTLKALAKKTNNLRFAYDSYRRFIQMFSNVVMEMPLYKFEQILDSVKEKNNYHSDLDLLEDDLLVIINEYKALYYELSDEEFPQDPFEQLSKAIEAVFKSWNNQRAKIYRSINEIPDDLGTAVNIQTMVFGNMGDDCGTGVAFTRHPSTGENQLFGEYLINAQGEDVVSGVRTPKPISTLQTDMPQLYEEFALIAKKLEAHYRDMQDIEFTIEAGKLYILQTRSGKRTINAAIEIAVDLVNEGKITKKEAILRINPKQLDQLLHPNFSSSDIKKTKIFAKGLPASPGAASGQIYFNAEAVLKAKSQGIDAILVRQETSPEDIEGMVNAIGILTSRGGMTSHAAVVARGMGKCCVVGCSEIKVNEQSKTLTVGDTIVKEGDFLSLDGVSGNVYLGHLKATSSKSSASYNTFMSWVNEIKRLKVRANADTVKDAEIALSLGAEGIGLCRTEHMFFAEDRILEVRKMILANNALEREKPLAKLLAIQTNDFYQILKSMAGYPVTIRLLDPPLHEFLPKTDKDIKTLSQQMNLETYELERRIEDLQEFNPMLGHRGCRLGITYPDIYIMQTKAIIEAVLLLKAEKIAVIPEIMVPLIIDSKEFNLIKAQMINEIDAIFCAHQTTTSYTIGTMIETPRACLVADEIAQYSEFFSFGTNDLTQMTYGFSRDDSHKFLQDYLNKQIFEKDPFQVLDQKGIGKLMKIAIKLGRKIKTKLKIGICGEHGGEPQTVEFCHHLGLDYVSCSPYRIPIAKLASAIAVIKSEMGNNS
mgnify:CR=1 FL=1